MTVLVEERLCACGCGERTSGPTVKFRRGHHMRNKNQGVKPEKKEEPTMVLSVEESVGQGYSIVPPTPREDIPAILVGYDEVEAFARDFRKKISELQARHNESEDRERRIKDDLAAIRGMLAEAIDKWAAGRDEEARTLVRNAAARAGGH